MTVAMRQWIGVAASLWIFGTGILGLAHLRGYQRPLVDVSEAPADGPMIVRGSIRTGARRPSPSGVQNAAWVAGVTQTSLHGSAMSVCSDMDVDGLFVDDGKARLGVDRGFFGSGGFGFHASIVGFPRFDTMPRSLASRCDGEVNPRFGEATYFETALVNGTRVEISGCRVADRIELCRDGADEITAWYVQYRGQGLFEHYRHDRTTLVRRLEILTVACLGLVVFGAFRARKSRGYRR